MCYWVVRVLSKIILIIFFNFKVTGLENIPQKTNFIVVANHGSFLDPFIVGVAIAKRINWLAARFFYSYAWFKWFFRKLDALSTGNVSERAVFLLEANKNVGLFPEGCRSHNGSLGEFRRGAALLAFKTGRPVVPCVINGAYEVLPRGKFFPKLFLPIEVKIGKPIYLLKEFEKKIDDVYLQKGTAKIKSSMEEMLNAG